MHSLNFAKQTILIILNEEMNDIMKINNSLEESTLLIKGISEIKKTKISEYAIRYIRS